VQGIPAEIGAAHRGGVVPPGAPAKVTHGRLAAAAAGICFGALGIFAQAAYADGADILGLLPLRFLVAGGVLALAAWRSGEPWPPRRRIAVCLALGGSGYLTFTLLFFATLRHASPGVAALLLYLNPFVVFAGSVLLGRERFRGGALLTLVVAVAGLALVLMDGPASRTGIVLGLITAVCYGTYLMLAAGALADLPPLAATALICLGAGGVALIAAGAFGGELPRTPAGWQALAGITFVSTVLALGLLTLALQRIPPSEVATIMMLEPVSAALLSALVLGQAFTLQQAIGAAITLVACGFFVRRRYAVS
jgi:drug/metabolite transporter (DMT)-like permease